MRNWTEFFSYVLVRTALLLLGSWLIGASLARVFSGYLSHSGG